MCLTKSLRKLVSVDGSAKPITTAKKQSDWLEVKKPIFFCVVLTSPCVQCMLRSGPISTNTEEQLWQKNCHRPNLQHWVQWRGPWNFTQGSVLDSPTSNRDSAFTTVRKVTTTAPLLVRVTEAKVVTDSA